MLTREDAKNFLTKDDVKKFATKDDIKNFATKDDLLNLEKRFGKKFATKKDLKNFVTKDYFTTQLKKELEIQLKKQTEDICQINTELFTSTDELKANKEDLRQLTTRVDRLEHKVVA